MRIRTALLALLALPLAAGAVPAHAGEIGVPGCYGAGGSGTVVCDPTVEYSDPPGVEFYQDTVPVCAGTCYDVPVTLVRFGPSQSFLLCVTYTDGAGSPHRKCDDELIAVLEPKVLDDLLAGLMPRIKALLCELSMVTC